MYAEVIDSASYGNSRNNDYETAVRFSLDFVKEKVTL